MGILDLDQSLKDAAGHVFFNHEIIDAHDEKAQVFMGNHTVLYSGGCFGGVIFVDGKIYQAEKHAWRLIDSAERLKIKTDLKPNDVHDAMNAVMAANGYDRAGKEGYLRPFFMRAAGIRVKTKGMDSLLGVIGIEKSKYWEDEIYARGLHLITAQTRKINSSAIQQEAKAGANYTASIIAEEEADQAGADDALMLKENGSVAEVSVANIFYFKDGVLYTPKPDGSFLNGITRQTVIKIAQNLNIEVVEVADMTLKDLYQADEVFTTGSATRITPVCRLDHQVYELAAVPALVSESVYFKTAGWGTLRLMQEYDAVLRDKPGAPAIAL